MRVTAAAGRPASEEDAEGAGQLEQRNHGDQAAAEQGRLEGFGFEHLAEQGAGAFGQQGLRREAQRAGEQALLEQAAGGDRQACLAAAGGAVERHQGEQQQRPGPEPGRLAAAAHQGGAQHLPGEDEDGKGRRGRGEGGRGGPKGVRRPGPGPCRGAVGGRRSSKAGRLTSPSSCSSKASAAAARASEARPLRSRKGAMRSRAADSCGPAARARKASGGSRRLAAVGRQHLAAADQEQPPGDRHHRQLGLGEGRAGGAGRQLVAGRFEAEAAGERRQQLERRCQGGGARPRQGGGGLGGKSARAAGGQPDGLAGRFERPGERFGVEWRAQVASPPAGFDEAAFVEVEPPPAGVTAEALANAFFGADQASQPSFRLGQQGGRRAVFGDPAVFDHHHPREGRGPGPRRAR